MKKLLYFLFLLTLIGCVKDVYNEDKIDEEENPKPSEPSDEEKDKLPDLSVPATFNWNEVYVKIPVTENMDMDNLQVYFPPLKYNKKFVYSYTFDDCTVMAYGKAFCMINKKWVDDWKFYHVGQQKTTGAIPAKTLGYTDGCGGERRFALGVAIWPDSRNSQIDDFMKPTNKDIDKYYPHLVWKDAIPLIDFGCELYFHDVNTTDHGDDVLGILNGMKVAQAITKNMLGRKMKVMARPGGNNLYCAAAREYDDIVMMAVENNTDIGPAVNITFDNDEVELKKISQYRRFVESTPTVDQLWPDLNTAALAGNYAWKHDFSHGPENFQYILDLFEKLNDEFGKDGLDIVWFATLDEVYEYNYLRRNCIIEKSISDNVLTLKFSCPSSDFPDELMFHRDFSIILKGVVPLSTANISTGKNVYGLSLARQNTDYWMINIDCNKSLLDKAERYTSVYEKEQSVSAKEDALYFVNQLREDLRKPFENRIR